MVISLPCISLIHQALRSMRTVCLITISLASITILGTQQMLNKYMLHEQMNMHEKQEERKRSFRQLGQ